MTRNSMRVAKVWMDDYIVRKTLLVLLNQLQIVIHTAHDSHEIS